METLEEWEQRIEEREQKILQAFFEYAAHKTLSAFDTPVYFARQILPEESFFLKANIINDLIKSMVMVMVMRG